MVVAKAIACAAGIPSTILQYPIAHPKITKLKQPKPDIPKRAKLKQPNIDNPKNTILQQPNPANPRIDQIKHPDPPSKDILPKQQLKHGIQDQIFIQQQ